MKKRQGKMQFISHLFKLIFLGETKEIAIHVVRGKGREHEVLTRSKR